MKPRDDRIPTFAYDAYRATAQFISPDGRTLLFRVDLAAGSPGTTAALQAIPAIRTAVAAVARSVGATAWGVAGQAAAAADVSAVSGSDIVKIAPVVLAVLFLLLALVLRSLVAPLYLVASVALSYLASLGLAVLIFVVLGHQLGVNFTLPFFLFIFIMALGEDYNILVMSRIREEAGRCRSDRRWPRPSGAPAPPSPPPAWCWPAPSVCWPWPPRARSARSVPAWHSASCSTPSWCAPCSCHRPPCCAAGGTGGRRACSARCVTDDPTARLADAQPAGDGARRAWPDRGTGPPPRKARARGMALEAGSVVSDDGGRLRPRPQAPERPPDFSQTHTSSTTGRGSVCRWAWTTVSAATAQAVSASISTPVRAKASTVATTTTAPPSMRAVTATVPRGSG